MSLPSPSIHPLPFPREAMDPPSPKDPDTLQREFESLLPLEDDGAGPIQELPENAGELFLVGDLHGDLLALEGILLTIRRLAKRGTATLVCLGDLIDRGNASLPCLLRFLQERRDPFWKTPPVLLCGDHENGIFWNEGHQHFGSCVTHATLARQLNALPDFHAIGKALTHWLHLRPCALFDHRHGVILAHGGVPQQDLLETLVSPEDLESPECLRDFLWNRLTDARRKRPSRTVFGTEFGKENLSEFCKKASEFLPAEPRLLFCGHQHPFRGWQWISNDDKHGALCLHSTFQRPFVPDEELIGAPCFARYSPASEDSPLQIYSCQAETLEVLTAEERLVRRGIPWSAVAEEWRP